MDSIRLRISKRTYEALKDLASREHRSLGDVLDAAVAQYRERQFREDAKASVARLRDDPVAWQAHKGELAEWDSTLMDGLETEETSDQEVADVHEKHPGQP